MTKVRIRIDRTVDNCEDCPHFERVGDCDDPYCRHDKSPDDLDSYWVGDKLKRVDLKEEIHPECPALKRRRDGR